MQQTKNLRTGFIGCGNIAHFHADVLKHLGVQITCLSYRSNKPKAELFAQKYGIAKIYTDWHEMITESEIDFLWVTPSWDQIDLIFEEITAAGIPAFFEKPLALNAEKVAKVLNTFPEDYLKKFHVGYNRRYYKIVGELKSLLRTEKTVSVFVDIPEPIKGLNENLLKHRLVQNSSHMFDLLFYLFDSYEVKKENIIPLFPDKTRNDFIGTMTLKGIPVSFVSVWNSPQNYSLKIYTESEKVYQLSPFEELKVFEGFDIIDPTEEKPIRQYHPRIKFSKFEKSENNFKPGFLEQSIDFIENALNGRSSDISHSFGDSLKLLTFLKVI
jgi:predicted dehydrogenase